MSELRNYRHRGSTVDLGASKKPLNRKKALRSHWGPLNLTNSETPELTRWSDRVINMNLAPGH